MIRRNEGLSQLIRYQQEIKNKIQQTDNAILQGGRDEPQLKHLNELISEEDIIIKYLEVESSKLQPEVKLLYNKNLNRFKKKIKEHKEYTNSLFGAGAIKKTYDPYNVAHAFKIEEENNLLIGQKLTMHENQHIQQRIGLNLQQQGTLLEGGINRNQQIREDANDASNMINTIQRSILKRKIMFYSIFALLGLAIVFIVIHKVTK